MFKKILLSFIYIIILLPIVSIALSLDEAKSSGLVGEKPDGYIGAVLNSPEVSNLVITINDQRREEYQRISQDNGKSLDVIEKLAGVKLISKVVSGEYYMENGQWIKR